mmetsp:Transcript_28219/g.53381  ORF Transcript_28219/g.53381 Transcript_28219/m.53381 type:complete len:207 (-) Transcript_28219:7-627(-)
MRKQLVRLQNTHVHGVGVEEEMGVCHAQRRLGARLLQRGHLGNGGDLIQHKRQVRIVSDELVHLRVVWGGGAAQRHLLELQHAQPTGPNKHRASLEPRPSFYGIAHSGEPHLCHVGLPELLVPGPVHLLKRYHVRINQANVLQGQLQAILGCRRSRGKVRIQLVPGMGVGVCQHIVRHHTQFSGGVLPTLDGAQRRTTETRRFAGR